MSGLSSSTTPVSAEAAPCLAPGKRLVSRGVASYVCPLRARSGRGGGGGSFKLTSGNPACKTLAGKQASLLESAQLLESARDVTIGDQAQWPALSAKAAARLSQIDLRQLGALRARSLSDGKQGPPLADAATRRPSTRTSAAAWRCKCAGAPNVLRPQRFTPLCDVVLRFESLKRDFDG